MRFSFLFVLVIFSACSRAATTPKELSIPHAELTGPVPPISAHEKVLPTSEKNITIEEHALKKDPKRTCLDLLESNLYSHNQQVVFATLYAYALLQLAIPERALDNLLNTENPYLQLQLLMTLYETESPHLVRAAQKAMMSEYPILQLYGARFLAKKKTGEILPRIESLESKLPDDCLPYIAELYALEGSPQAQNHIKKLLSLSTSPTIAQCLCLIRIYQLMELYPVVASYRPTNPQEAEALAFALSILQTTSSEEHLCTLSHHSHPSVSIQALTSLNALGYQASMYSYRDLINSHSPFVFTSLDKTAFSTEELISLWPLELDWSARYGLALSLIERREALPLSFLFKTLYETETTLLRKNYSLSGTCFYISRGSKSERRTPEECEREYESDALTDQLVHKIAITFPEAFDEFAEKALSSGPVHLAPAIISALAETPSEQRSEMLSQLSKKPGRPYIRQLALFSLIQQKEIPLDQAILSPLLKTLRESLQSLLRPKSLFFLFRTSPSEKERKSMNEQQKLYFAAIAMLAQTKTESSSALLEKELQEAPEEYRSFISAALLHSLL